MKDCRSCKHVDSGLSLCIGCVEWLDGKPVINDPLTLEDMYEPMETKGDTVMIDHFDEDLDVVVNDKGGKQSDVKSRYDLVPPVAIAQCAEVLHQGAVKYGEFNWQNIPTHDHVNHAIRHLYRFLNQPNAEDLSHACVRIMFAIFQNHRGE